MDIQIIITLSIFAGLIFIGIVAFFTFKKIYWHIDSYKPWKIFIDISNKKISDFNDAAQLYICNQKTIFAQKINGEVTRANRRNEDEKEKIEKSKLFKKRKEHYLAILKTEYKRIPSNFLTFEFSRRRTKYTQYNYVKSSYQVYITEYLLTFSFDDIKKIYFNLKNINFETSLKSYHSKSQRKLLTKNLRQKIIERDNYTCQICGKYMPDEVGLQIDHIIPVSKGGKTVESNLRVLCSKCNLRKKDKYL